MKQFLVKLYELKSSGKSFVKFIYDEINNHLNTQFWTFQNDK